MYLFSMHARNSFLFFLLWKYLPHMSGLKMEALLGDRQGLNKQWKAFSQAWGRSRCMKGQGTHTVLTIDNKMQETINPFEHIYV